MEDSRLAVVQGTLFWGPNTAHGGIDIMCTKTKARNSSYGHGSSCVCLLGSCDNTGLYALLLLDYGILLVQMHTDDWGPVERDYSHGPADSQS
jgi:hypothetical protein